MYRANVQRTGVYAATGVRQLRGVRWKLELPIGLAHTYPASNGRVLCLVGEDQQLYTIDLLTQQQRWVAATGSTVFASPVVGDELVYLTNFAENSLLALDLKTGVERWRVQSGYNPALSLQTSVAVVGNVLYTGLGDGNLYALHAQTGELIWALDTHTGLALSPVAVSGGSVRLVCVCNVEGDLFVIDGRQRQQLWQGKIPSVMPMLFACPVIADNTLYIVGGDGQLLALSLLTGAIQWQLALGPMTSVAVSGDWLCVSRTDGSLFAVNQRTQATWTFETGKFAANPSPVIANGVVYLADRGPLFAIDLQTGRELWQFTAPDAEFNLFRPQVWGLQFADQLARLGTADRFSFSGFTAPIVGDGVVYIGSSFGYLYALY